jgi:glycosyltransferase involved in cell wall biosynthesis
MIMHFVYAVPRLRRIRGLSRVLSAYEAGRKRAGLPPSYRSGWLPGLSAPLAAPYSITVNLMRFLQKKLPCRLYDWQEHGTINYGPDDIVLGHPHPKQNTVIQQAFLSDKPCRAKILILPIHHAIASVNQYVIPLLDKADAVLGIMGPYWHDTLGDSFLAPWQHKIVRVDMALNAQDYPWIKRKFNAPGNRGFLHIGYNVPEKGPEVLAATMQRLPEFRKGWIGAGDEILYVPRITPFAYLTPEYIRKLAETYDIFVNTSVSDANPTTILEAMAWGFPVACTPQSGYYEMPSLMPLSTTDIGANVDVLTKMQYASNESLQALSQINRRLIETHYTWERFCGTVWQTLEAHK